MTYTIYAYEVRLTIILMLIIIAIACWLAYRIGWKDGYEQGVMDDLCRKFELKERENV